jgi:transposase
MDYAVYDLDFTSEGRRRVSLFSYILGYSRRQYLRFVASQDMTTTLQIPISAIRFLPPRDGTRQDGGIPWSPSV